MSDTKTNPGQEVTIVVNGRDKVVQKGELTFREIVLLAFPDAVFNDKTEFTVAYTMGADPKPKGTLTDGETIKVKNREVFNVSRTDRS